MDREEFLKSEKYDWAQSAIESSEGEVADKEMAKKIIDEIHRAAANNFTLWESKKEPGVKEVYSRINILELIDNIKGTNLSGLPHTIEEVTFVSSSTPTSHIFSIDGGTHTPIDITINRVFFEISRTLRHYKETGELLNSEVILLGSPLAIGGEITKAWGDSVKNKGIFETQSNTNAELIEEIVKQTEPLKVLLTGHSYGAVASMLTASYLSPETKQLTRVLADGPAPTFGGKLRLLKSLQLLVGLGIEEFIKIFINKLPNEAKYKTPTIEQYESQLRKLGIDYKNPEQETLKREISKVVMVQALTKGPSTFSNIYSDALPNRVYIRQGAFDPITFTFEYLKELKEQNILRKNMTLGQLIQKYKGTSLRGKARVYPYEGTHHINRFSAKNVRKWLNTSKNLTEL